MNKILIIAMIVVPLVIALVVFGKDILKFFKGKTEKIPENTIEKPSDGDRPKKLASPSGRSVLNSRPAFS